MAIIHDTTMTPGKLELLTAWLPAQPWYLDRGREPELTKTGGFRLDDPRGEVGIEFMVVTDGSGDQAVSYQVPMTYRASALAGADSGLIGTSEHGVLGQRWIYDGTIDPVLVAQLVAAIQGDAEPQAQGISHTPDPTVTGLPVTDGALTATGSAVAASGRSGTDLRVETTGAGLIVRINRVLWPDPAGEGQPGSAPLATAQPGGAPPAQPGLSATWRGPDGTRVRGVFATARLAGS